MFCTLTVLEPNLSISEKVLGEKSQGQESQVQKPIENCNLCLFFCFCSGCMDILSCGDRDNRDDTIVIKPEPAGFSMQLEDIISKAKAVCVTDLQAGIIIPFRKLRCVYLSSLPELVGCIDRQTTIIELKTVKFN